MNEQLRQAFINAAITSFWQLSQYSELKHYQIYYKPGKSLRKKVQGRAVLVDDSPSTTEIAGRWSKRWILVISINQLGKARQLVVKVRGSR